MEINKDVRSHAVPKVPVLKRTKVFRHLPAERHTSHFEEHPFRTAAHLILFQNSKTSYMPGGPAFQITPSPKQRRRRVRSRASDRITCVSRIIGANGVKRHRKALSTVCVMYQGGGSHFRNIQVLSQKHHSSSVVSHLTVGSTMVWCGMSTISVYSLLTPQRASCNIDCPNDARSRVSEVCA